MAYGLAKDAARFIRTEIAMAAWQGSIPPALTMAFLMSPFPLPVWGDGGFAAFLLKNCMGMATIMTLIMTWAVRMRVRKARAPSIRWNRADQPLLRLIPRWVLLRAPFFGICTVVIIGPLSIGVAAALGIETIDRVPFTLFMMCQCAVIAVCLTPFVLVGAMSDLGNPKIQVAP